MPFFRTIAPGLPWTQRHRSCVLYAQVCDRKDGAEEGMGCVGEEEGIMIRCVGVG